MINYSKTLLAILVFMLPLAFHALAASDTGDAPAIGTKMTDGSIYAGSVHRSKSLYTTPADAPAPGNWTDAMKYCDTLDAFSYQDWRLPAQEELAVLYANREQGSLKDTFRQTPGSLATSYWSSTPDSAFKDMAWSHDFADGTTSSINILPVLSFRCVRG